MADVRLGDAVTQGGLSRRIIAVLVVEFLIVVGGLTTAVWLGRDSSSTSGPVGNLVHSKAAYTSTDQASAVSVARQFVLNMDAFTPANIQGYLANVMPLLTTKAQADVTNQFGQFNQLAGTLMSQLTQSSEAAALVGAGSIQFAGLQSITGTTANVVVAHDVLYGGVKPDECASKQGYCQTFRWVVSLRKINGVWLVDTYNQNPTA